MKLVSIICLVLSFLSLPVHAQPGTFNQLYSDSITSLGTGILAFDDGYVVIGAGYSTMPTGRNALKLLSIDSLGNQRFIREYSAQEKFISPSALQGIFQSTDSTFFCTLVIGDSLGVRQGAIWVFNSLGDTIATNNYWYEDGNGQNLINSINTISKTDDGGYIAAGHTSKSKVINVGSNANIWVLKLDSAFNVIWSKSYGGQAYDAGWNIVELTNGDYLLGGISWSFGPGSGSPIIYRLDTIGNVIWQKSFGTAQRDLNAYVEREEDGGYYVLFGQDTQIRSPTPIGIAHVLERYSATDTLLWRKVLADKYERSFFRFAKFNNDLWIAGSLELSNGTLNGLITKVDTLGNILWEKAMPHPSNGIFDGHLYDFVLTPDNKIVATGWGSNSSPFFRQDFWVIKLDTTGCSMLSCDTINPCPEPCDTVGILNNTLGQIRIYPNPAQGQLHISLAATTHSTVQFQLFTLLGNVVLAQELNGGVSVDISTLTPGVYLYQLSHEADTRFGKLVVE